MKSFSISKIWHYTVCVFCSQAVCMVGLLLFLEHFTLDKSIIEHSSAYHLTHTGLENR